MQRCRQLRDEALESTYVKQKVRDSNCGGGGEKRVGGDIRAEDRLFSPTRGHTISILDSRSKNVASFENRCSIQETSQIVEKILRHLGIQDWHIQGRIDSPDETIRVKEARREEPRRDRSQYASSPAEEWGSEPHGIRNPEVKYTGIFINNEWHPAVSGKTFPTINPTTGKKICDVAAGDKADIDKAVAAAQKAFAFGSEWRRMDASARGTLLNRLADLIERDREYIANEHSSSSEGMPSCYSSVSSDEEVGSTAEVEEEDASPRESLRKYYAGWANKYHGKTIPIDGDYVSFTRQEPVGVCGQIIPWNFPILMQAWKFAPALAMGNTVVMKTAEQTPLTANYVAELTKEAGFPAGVVNVVPGLGATAGAALTVHPDVDKIAFTGSTEIGQLVAQAANKVNTKRITLELGGKSPVLVFKDADSLAVASDVIATALPCLSSVASPPPEYPGSTVIPHPAAAVRALRRALCDCANFKAKVAASVHFRPAGCEGPVVGHTVAKLKIPLPIGVGAEGMPLRPNMKAFSAFCAQIGDSKEYEHATAGGEGTAVVSGPQVDEAQMNKILDYIAWGKKEGAKLCAGGKRVDREGFFIESTVFGDVKDNMKISREEIFGPVMQISKFKTMDEVIERANDSIYGLAAGIFTQDLDKALYAMQGLRAGSVWVNCYDVFDAGAPFGGYKMSGVGRELGEDGLKIYSEMKTVRALLTFAQLMPHRQLL
nr:unnamed protein product [Spirometra erinaceieuropaei]